MAPAADVRPLVRLSISVQVEEDGKRERGSSGGGGRFGYDWFWVTSTVKPVRTRGQKPCVWRWSIFLPWRHLRDIPGGTGRWLAGRAAA